MFSSRIIQFIVKVYSKKTEKVTTIPGYTPRHLTTVFSCSRTLSTATTYCGKLRLISKWKVCQYLQRKIMNKPRLTVAELIWTYSTIGRWDWDWPWLLWLSAWVTSVCVTPKQTSWKSHSHHRTEMTRTVAYCSTLHTWILSILLGFSNFVIWDLINFLTLAKFFPPDIV